MIKHSGQISDYRRVSEHEEKKYHKSSKLGKEKEIDKKTEPGRTNALPQWVKKNDRSKNAGSRDGRANSKIVRYASVREMYKEKKGEIDGEW